VSGKYFLLSIYSAIKEKSDEKIFSVLLLAINDKNEESVKI
jgi:hypothetical protein